VPVSALLGPAPPCDVTVMAAAVSVALSPSDLLAMEMKFMPQMMLHTQPTMMAKVRHCSSAATRFRHRALAGLPCLVGQPHRQVQAEKNVPRPGTTMLRIHKKMAAGRGRQGMAL